MAVVVFAISLTFEIVPKKSKRKMKKIKKKKEKSC